MLTIELINQSISHYGRASKADGKSIDYREIKTTTIALSESIYIGKQGNKLKPDSTPVSDEGKGQLREMILSRFVHYIYNY